MEDKITLDRESFRTLASDTRVSILKSLDRRRKMLTELSKELKMSPSTVKEHMDNLCAAGLTVQMDDGHKWKYYELTTKGKNILHPGETRIWVILSVSAIAFAGILYDMMSRGSQNVLMATREAAPMLTAPGGAGAADKAASAAQALPVYHIIGLAIAAVAMGSCMAYLALIRKRCF